MINNKPIETAKPKGSTISELHIGLDRWKQLQLNHGARETELNGYTSKKTARYKMLHL